MVKKSNKGLSQQVPGGFGVSGESLPFRLDLLGEKPMLPEKTHPGRYRCWRESVSRSQSVEISQPEVERTGRETSRFFR